MSVYKRGKVFYMNFTVNGVRVFRSTGMTTKREAKRVEAAERHRLLKDSRQSPQEKTANTPLLDAIEETYQAKWKYDKDSQRSYRRACNLADLIGNVPLKDIDEGAVALLTRKLESRDSSAATINRYLACLKTILKHMKQQTDYISLRKERKGRIRVLSKEEERQVIGLLRYTDHAPRRAYFHEIADLVEVLVDTGMRLGEALSLRYEDIDFNSNLISIWINKGDRPRSVPMTSRVKSTLEARQESNQEKPFSIKAHQAETAWRWVRKEMRMESDRELVIHSLRHTTASRMVNAGVDLYVVKDILGHASIATTQIYAHLAPHKLAHAVSVLE
ncbi:tyrosine-type recombinase/integrase [Syntrophotalea acetylenica]|uniref:Integrase n=1 Tax=Syntrophotalea acetylenica TaxID=29542 RepID=A0A1L3GJA0_SYNAC|nr:site-specific integrase [Syntrophotalea acetylenica]APG25955.1 integrase [Syntrophotalea acetylenica]APG44023.1 integrase [Syntrophotalea acetylenica]